MEEFRRITLYRIKDEANGAFSRDDDVEFDRIELPGDVATVLVKYEDASGKARSDADIPWIRILNSAAGERRYRFEARNRFPRATVGINFTVSEGEPVTYVAAFGLGADSIIDRRKLVYDFGIKVAMNICDIDKLRRVQTTAHEAVSRQTERQASTGTNLAVFGVNTETEFLRMLSGIVAPAYAGIVESFRGKESISLKLPKESIPDMPALVQLCRALEERYKSDDYKNTDLKVYDQLKVENDPVVKEALDTQLAAKVAAKDFTHVHLAPPDFVEGEDTQFAYEKKTEENAPQLFDDLRIEDLVSIPRRRLKGLTANTLRSWDVYRVDEATGATHRAWSAYRCMVAEIELHRKTYVLSNGQWRQVSEKLKEKVDKYFENNNLMSSYDFLPDNIKIYDADRDQFREEIYNRHVARNDPDTYLFDKSKVQIAGKKIYEICDLFRKDGSMVHVKRHSSGSASINHIFTQAKLYAHAFSAEAITRQGMRDWIDNNEEPENAGKANNDFKGIIRENDGDVDEKSHELIFCILTSAENMSLADLPFMTQYELMLAHRYLTHDRKFRSSVTFKQVDLTKP
jgi:uncharacterized protein (TIGR04141 family)